jgi:hypothetical protein
MSFRIRLTSFEAFHRRIPPGNGEHAGLCQVELLLSK